MLISVIIPYYPRGLFMPKYEVNGALEQGVRPDREGLGIQVWSELCPDNHRLWKTSSGRASYRVIKPARER